MGGLSQCGEDKPVVFSNYDQLDIYLDGQSIGFFHPDHTNYPDLLYPSFFLDLSWDHAASSTLLLDGLVRGKVVISRTMAGSRKGDRLWIKADDPVIMSNGAGSTRISFGVADSFGNSRSSPQGQRSVLLAGAATLVGNSSFDLSETGAVGAVWVRSLPVHAGIARITIL